MADVIKAPGVYIAEPAAFPISVAQVETAIPAFIGYTEKADDNGIALTNKPKRINSMAEYITYFGGLQRAIFNVKKIPANGPLPEGTLALGQDVYQVLSTLDREETFLLYPSMKLFFNNGGTDCYIVSIGGYDDGSVDAKTLCGGMDLLKVEQEPTMVVIPDAVQLSSAADCGSVQQYAIKHCSEMQSRVAILDVYGGYVDDANATGDPISDFRSNIGTSGLDFAAAYYPWLQATILGDGDITYKNVDPGDLIALLTAEASLSPQTVQIPQSVLDQIKAPPKDDGSALNNTLLSSSHIFPLLLTEI
jgi:uncharacterized protein